MKKLLISTDTFFPKRDGITRFLDELIPKLSDSFEITILAPSYTKEFVTEEFKGAEVVRFPVSRIEIEQYPAVKPAFRKIKSYVKKAEIVWIHSMAPLGAMTVLMARRMKKPIVAYIHAIEWEHLAHAVFKSKRIKAITIKLVKRLATYLYNKCTLLLVPSKNIAQHLKEQGIKTKKAIIHLGTKVGQFVPPKDKEEAKEIVKIDPKLKVIGYCGRISKEKNLPTLCKAFMRLRKKHKNIFLLIVGDGDRKEIEEIVKNNYKITGFVEDVVPYLQAMDVFVLPSLTETTSLATLEAMSCGLPVIATPVGHVKDYIESNYNGYLFPRENVDILVKKIERLLGNKELRKAIGMIARKTVQVKYSWKKTASQIKKVLEELE
ncbi:glycosyltransferase family 4 protein [Candidatus Woesearchaeota archaeon]|nr:glycosyltransferase family 4 protein [Candidatus Woesearchaeota archaeon]